MQFSSRVHRIYEHRENQCGQSRFERLGDGIRGARKLLFRFCQVQSLQFQDQSPQLCRHSLLQLEILSGFHRKTGSETPPFSDSGGRLYIS
jgi:hypothetical protein